MNQMGRMSEEEKYIELLDQFQAIEKAKINI
jgi:hypothetical protein